MKLERSKISELRRLPAEILPVIDEGLNIYTFAANVTLAENYLMWDGT